jgi:hypothetical protein
MGLAKGLGMKNERGFVYPIVLILCTLLLFGFVTHTNIYLQEKRFIAEQNYIIQLDSYLQKSIVDFLEEVSSNGNSSTFSFSYDGGVVTLVVVIKNESEWHVAMRATLNEPSRTRNAQFYYDPNHHVIKEYWGVSRRE